MIFISHRGNLNGRQEKDENEPNYIDRSIEKGYDVEIDVWLLENEIYLGHDNPQYKVNFQWFLDRIDKIWIHCKNIEAIIFFNSSIHDFNYFWHEGDKVALTSRRIVWAYPGNQPMRGSISVLPEIWKDDVSECLGICSDYIESYKSDLLNNLR